MKVFSQIVSCYRPRAATQASKVPPSINDNHRAPLPSAAAGSRSLTCGRCQWRPALPNIMEDRVGVAEYHENNNVDRKPDNKSSATWVSHDDQFVDRRNSYPIMMLPPFSMF